MRPIAIGLLLAIFGLLGSCEDDSKYTTGGPTPSATPTGGADAGTDASPD